MASLRRDSQSQDTVASPTAMSPTSQYPFPSVDSSRRPRSSRGSLRRGSAAASIASLGTALDNQNSVAETGQNAISTLLQHPIVRTGLQPHTALPNSGYKAPTQRDIAPVALTNIPHIEAKAFQPYLAQVGSLYEAFQRAKSEDEGDSALFHREKKDSRSEEWDAVLSKKNQRPGQSRSGSVASSLPSPTEAPAAQRRQSTQRRQAVTPLSTIPSVYSEEDFHLENPRTFDIVSEHSELVRDPKAAPTGRKSLATNAILQEKLSWYMDTVEVHLISSISTASKSFFSALGSLRELHAEAEDSVQRIQKLRKDLGRLDKDLALDGLKVVKLKQRRNNVRQLAEAILQLGDIVAAVRECEIMVDKGEIDGALNELDDVERLIMGRSGWHKQGSGDNKYSRRDLRGIKALEGSYDDLNQLRFRIGRGYEGRFHNSLLGDIRAHVQKTEATSTLERWGTAYNRLKPGQRRGPSTFPAYMNIGPDLRSELEAEMKGLNRARHSTPAATAFRALVLREMKNMIRKQLPSSNDDDSVSTISASTYGGRQMSQQEKSSILARNIRALDPDDWYSMLAKIYTNTSEGLRRLSVQVKILLDITSNLPEASVKSPPSTPDPAVMDAKLSPRQGQGRARSASSVQAEMQQALDLSSLLGEGVDLIQNQLTKVVKVRSQQNADLPLDDFLKFFTLNRLFADECEAISGRTGLGLKTVLDGQIKEFVARFGDLQRQNLIQVLDSDKWDAKDFGERENMMLKHVQDGNTDDAASWLQSTQIWLASTATASSNGTITNGAPKDKIRSATIDEQRFILPESATAMLSSAESFLHLAAGIPSMSSDVAALLLDNLRHFNSRTSQLILGAGATRSAGLKNITTKHLALSSQALSFITALIPYIREFFRRHLPSSQQSTQQTLSDFDSVKRRLQDHQLAIHEKLVEIMSGRSSMHIKTMKSVNWEEAARNTSLPVSLYMETLCKETTTLHKVLSKHLPESSVRGIMGPVFENYRTMWEKAFSEVEVVSEKGKERLLQDALTFQSRLGKLDGFGDTGDHIVTVVKKREVIGAGAHDASNATIDTTPTSTASTSTATAAAPATSANATNESNPKTDVDADTKSTITAAGEAGAGAETKKDEPEAKQAEPTTTGSQ